MTLAAPTEKTQPVVREFRQILLWPLQLMPIRQGLQIQNHWELLEQLQPDNPWKAHPRGIDSDDGDALKEREYTEFVTFLPYVQRTLFGEGKGAGQTAGESPIRIYRRHDVSAVRVKFPGKDVVEECPVKRVELYFFYDLDVAILVVELAAQDIAFGRAQELLYRFGRSYPTYWTPEGLGGHCMEQVEWLGADGSVLASSDYQRRDKYLRFASRHRSPGISEHWDFLLRPLVSHHSDQDGPIRYRLVEYHRMPVAAFLSLDKPSQLSDTDFVRLTMIARPGSSDSLPTSAAELQAFETRHCIDRYWNPANPDNSGTRLLCSGASYVMVVSADSPTYIPGGPSLLEQFRRQYFLVFLLPHLHKAALCMLSDRVVHTLNRMDIYDPVTIRRFKRGVRQVNEIFLRFSHRYWFNEVTDQPQARGLYNYTSRLLGTAELFEEVRDEIASMVNYLDSDALRRQANTVLRLTVVTIFGLIGTITTGFLGMNLIAEPDASLHRKLLYFAVVFVVTTLITVVTISRSKRFSDYMDALSDERISIWGKIRALFAVLRKPPSID